MRSVTCLCAAAFIVAAVFLSPLEQLSQFYLASAHVVKHLLLNLIAPLFIVAGLPVAVLRRFRPPPALTWLAGTASLAAWYIPSLYNAALANRSVETLQSATWLCGGVLLFLPLFTPAVANRLRPVPQSVIYLFAIAVVASITGLRLATLEPGLYGSYAAPTDPWHILGTLQNTWHLTPEEDQQTAGFLFWIGSCAVFLSSVKIMFYRMYKSERP